MKFVFLFLFLLTSCQHKPTQTESELKTATPKVTCTQDKDIRYLEIRNHLQQGCNLFYTKFQTEKSIAKASSDKKYCSDVQQKIISNLSQSGFVCE